MAKEFEEQLIGITEEMPVHEKTSRKLMIHLVDELVRAHTDQEGWVPFKFGKAAPYIVKERLETIIAALLDGNIIVRAGRVLSEDEVKNRYLNVGAPSLSEDSAIELTSEEWKRGGMTIEGTILHVVFEEIPKNKPEWATGNTLEDDQRTYIQARRDAIGLSVTQKLIEDTRIQTLRPPEAPLDWINGPIILVPRLQALTTGPVGL